MKYRNIAIVLGIIMAVIKAANVEITDEENDDDVFSAGVINDDLDVASESEIADNEFWSHDSQPGVKDKRKKLIRLSSSGYDKLIVD